MREGDRQVVPFRVVANHRGRILGAMHPFHTRPTRGGVDRVAEEDEHRRLPAKGVVNRDGRVLQADGAVGEDRHRPAFDLGVPVGDEDRRFLVTAGQQLRASVAAVVDDRFVQPAETGTGIGGDVFETE
jgi:hypothetical protein